MQALKREAFSCFSPTCGSSSSASFCPPFLLTSSFTSTSCRGSGLCVMEGGGLQCYPTKGPLNAGPRPEILRRARVTQSLVLLHLPPFQGRHAQMCLGNVFKFLFECDWGGGEM